MPCPSGPVTVSAFIPLALDSVGPLVALPAPLSVPGPLTVSALVSVALVALGLAPWSVPP